MTISDEMMPRPIGRGIVDLAVDVLWVYLNYHDQRAGFDQQSMSPDQG
jgi:hypothetical protein